MNVAACWFRSSQDTFPSSLLTVLQPTTGHQLLNQTKSLKWMGSHSRRRQGRAAEWQRSNSVGDPADQSVYSADTFSGRCEGLGFSSDRIYCPLCPQLLKYSLSKRLQHRKRLKTWHTHTHTHTLTGDFLCKWKRENKPLSDIFHHQKNKVQEFWVK